MAKGGFRGGYPGGGNQMDMMRKAQKMQQDVARAQAELNEREFTASSGGGMVSVTVTGNKDVKAIVINPACVDPDDVEMLQDLVLSAVNEALRQADDAMSSRMNSFTSGLNIPGLG